MIWILVLLAPLRSLSPAAIVGPSANASSIHASARIASASITSSRIAEETWADYFVYLAQLERMDPSTAEFAVLATRLGTMADEREREGLKRKDSLEKSRTRVVRFHLQRMRGLPARAATEPETEPIWLPHEAWFATRALVPGHFRVQSAIAALDETALPDPERVAWAARVADEERALGRLDLAERAATAVFARVPDADNALRLARILALRGSGAEARAVIGRALLGSPDDAARARLLLARARVSSGIRDERGALAGLGAALALGSDEAALDLAWRALDEGERRRAEILGRAVLGQGPARVDALSVWGRSLLPVPLRPHEALAGASRKVP